MESAKECSHYGIEEWVTLKKSLLTIAEERECLQNQKELLEIKLSEETQNSLKTNKKLNEITALLIQKANENENLSKELINLRAILIKTEEETDFVKTQKKLLEKELLDANEDFFKTNKKLQEITKSVENSKEKNQSLNLEINDLKGRFVKLEEERDSIQKLNHSLEKELIGEKDKVLTASEELSVLKQSLSEEKQKTVCLETQLKNWNQIQSQKVGNIFNYEKLISNLKTQLSTEEMSFEFERKIKERYAKENQEMGRKIQSLQNEIKSLKLPGPQLLNNSSVNSLSTKEELIDPNHLNTRKRRDSSLDHSLNDEQRLSILKYRNSLLSQHLRSSYAVELQYRKDVNSEEIRQVFT